MSRQRGASQMNVGEKGEVFVTAFEVDKQENAFRFWGQFDNVAVEKLETLMQEAQAHAEQSAHPPPGALSPGDVCLAKFMEDGQWYRARVESVTGNDVIAYFLDFGNTEIIPRVMVRSADSLQKVLSLPPQATNCKLANVEPVLDNATLKGGTHDYLRKQLEYQTFCAEVIARIGGNLEVKLSDVGSGRDAAHKIISDGFGRAATGQVSPSKVKGFKIMGLEVGSRDRVFVSNVNTPNQFWIQQETMTKDLDDLMNDMLNHYSQVPTGGRRKRFTRGDALVTTFSDDGSYYRALVTSTIGSDSYEVFFVDYGNSDIKTSEDLMEIDPLFLQLPAVAIECCLSEVDPDSCNTDEASGRFEELVVEKTICCKVTRKIGDKCSLLMIDPTGGENADIASVLVKEGHAGRPTQIHSPQSKPIPPPAASPSQGYSARRLPPSPSAVRELDFQSPNFKAPQVNVGDTLAVQLTSVTSGAEFSCHLVKDAEKFDALIDNLNQVYASSSPGDHGVREVAGGLPCCVQFSEDNSWYRAQVRYVRGQDVDVEYVDYGNRETVTPAQVKSLKPQFFSMPTQAILCSLDGVPKSSAAKSQEVKDFLDSTVAELDLMAKIVSKQKEAYSIELTDPTSGDNINNMVKSMLQVSSPKQRSPRDEMLKEYKPASMRDREKLQVFVGHVDDQAKLYVQKSSTVAELETLMDHMSQHFQSFGTSIPNLSIGMSCAAQYSGDEAWYRAKVTGMRRNGKVEVTFVDYGNSEMVNSSQIKMLTPDMVQLPAQAMPCMLDGLPAGQQTSEEISKLQACIEQEFTLEVKHKDNMSGMYTVRLTGTDGKCINEQFKKPQRTPQTQNERQIRSPPRSSESGSDFGSRSGAGFKAKSPPQDRFSQNDHQSGRQQRGKGLFNNDGGGDATDMKQSRSKRNSASSSNVSDRSGPRSNRSDDSRGQPPVTLQFTEVAFPASGKIEVYISHVNSPSEFWCQTAASTPQLQRLMSELHARYSSLSAKDKQLKNTTVGTPCIAKFSSDGCWYRGVVVNKHKKELEVMFVDYGNSEKVALGNLKAIVPDLVKLPVLGVKCTLPGDQEWHSGQTDAMREAADRAEPFQCQVKSTDCGVYEVELMWEGKMMTKVLKAVKPPVAPVAAPVVAAKAAPVPQKASPAPPPAKASARPVQPQSQSSPIAMHLSSEFEKLTVGEMEDVVVCYWESPFTFWCQLAKKCTDLDALMERVSSVEQGGRVDISHVKEGLPCCAKYAEDGAWYRARITKAVPRDSPEVLFVDYGNHSSVALADLRVLPVELSSLPAQAIHCSLSGLTPAQAVSTAAQEKFTELVTEKQLVAHIIKKDASALMVTLHDTNTSVDIDISAEVKNVVGEVKEPDTYPLPEGSSTSEMVYVTSVHASAGKVYLQRASSTEQLDAVSALLQTTYEACGPEDHQLLHPVTSQACCVKFSEDGMWYRGVVTASTPMTATVLFIDYGNCEEKILSELKSPTEELLKTPHLALECHLDGLPLLSWRQEDADHFLNLTAEKELTCTFTSTTHPFSVALKDDTVDVNEEMMKLVKSIDVATGNEHAEYSAPDVKAGDHAGYLVNVDASTGNIYIQLTSVTEQLDEVTALLVSTYGSCGDNLQLEQVCKKQACCAKFSEDGQWYRGMVKECTAAGAVVCFVDYGNSEGKQLSELKAPTPELLKVPHCAVECQLAGTVGSPWTQTAVDHLLELTADKELTCTVTSTSAPITVSLKDGAVDVNAEMIKFFGHDTQLGKTMSYPAPSLETGTQTGYAVNVDASTGRVYIQLAAATEQLDNITALLEATYSSDGGEDHPLLQPASGQACCTKFSEDDQWYRGCITSCTPSTASVFFVDYGNSEEKQFGDLKAPTQELLEIPGFAIECQLEDVLVSPWQQDAVDRYLDITAEKELACSFNTCTKPFTVTLKDGEVDINEEMKKLVGEKPKAGEMAFKSLIPGLAEHKKAEVYVTSTASPEEFWLQPLAGEEALSLLMDEVNNSAEDPNTLSLPNPTTGSPCIARYSADQGWYRAVITDLVNDVATVRFVDYGNSDTVPVAELKTIGEELMKLEAQAVGGLLAGVGPAEGKVWSPEAAEFFEAAVTDKLLLMEVVSESNDKLCVKLLDMGMSLAEKLMTAGHAIQTVESIRQFPSVTSTISEPDSLEQVSKDLVEQVLASTLLDLSLEDGDGETGGAELTEADMGACLQQTQGDGAPDTACSAQELEDVAHNILDGLLAELALNLNPNQAPPQEPAMSGNQEEELAEVASGETEKQTAPQGQEETPEVEEDKEEVERAKEGLDDSAFGESNEAEEDSGVVEALAEVRADEEEEVSDQKAEVELGGDHQELANLSQEDAEEDGPEAAAEEDEALDVAGVDASSAAAAAGEHFQESFRSDEAFQSDNEEECFQDVVATEADQGKTSLDTEAVEDQRDGEGEEGGTGLSDAFQDAGEDAAETLEESTKPEADQETCDHEVVTDSAGKTTGVGDNRDEENQIEEGGDAEEGEDVEALPEDDITMAMDDGDKGVENESKDSIEGGGPELQGDLAGVFAKMSVEEQGEEGVIEEEGEEDRVKDGSDAAKDADVCLDRASDDVSKLSQPEVGVMSGAGETMPLDGGGDASVAKPATMEGAEPDVNDSFETARGDISNTTSPGGDASMYASFGTMSAGSDLDSTLECEKTFGGSESSESGTGSGKGFADAGLGGGDAPTATPSPPRCDSGIMEDPDQLDKGKHETEMNPKEKVGLVTEETDKETVVNGHD